MDIETICEHLSQNEYGIFVSMEKRAVSFPESGYNSCFNLEENSFWFKHRNNIILAAVKRYPPKKGYLLDVGGGNGYVTRRLLDEGYPAILLEPGYDGAYNGKIKRGIPYVICSAFEDSGIPKASMAAIGCFDVLEHICDEENFLAKLSEILKPGGMFYLTVPAKGWLWSLSDVSAGHYRRYGRRQIISALGEKFRIVYVTCFFGCLTLPLLLLRVLPFKLGIAKGKNIMSEKKEHGVNNGIHIVLLEHILTKEIKMIRDGKCKNRGTSLLVVAQKT